MHPLLSKLFRQKVRKLCAWKHQAWSRPARWWHLTSSLPRLASCLHPDSLLETKATSRLIKVRSTHSAIQLLFSSLQPCRLPPNSMNSFLRASKWDLIIKWATTRVSIKWEPINSNRNSRTITPSSKSIWTAYCKVKIDAQQSWSATSPTSTLKRCSWRVLTDFTRAITTSSTCHSTSTTAATLATLSSTSSTQSTSFPSSRTWTIRHGRVLTRRRSAKSPLDASKESANWWKTSTSRVRRARSSPWS